MTPCTISRKNPKGFTLLEVVISMTIMALLAGCVYAIVSSAISASQTTMTQQLILRRLDAFLRVTRDAFLNLPAQGSVTLEPGQQLVIAKPQELFGQPSLAGGSLVMAARAQSDGTRTMTMLTIPANASDRQRAEALASRGVPLLPKIRKPRWSFMTGSNNVLQWKEELPAGSPRPVLVRLQLEIDELPHPLDAVFYIPPIAATPPPPPPTETNTPSPAPIPPKT